MHRWTRPNRCDSSRRGRRLWSFVALALAATGLSTAPLAPASAAPAFADVPEGLWYSDAIAWMADSGVTTGTSPTTFSPDDLVTRAQTAAFLERYAQVSGEPGDHGFADVPAGSYYDGSVTYLVEYGITTGTTASTYSPDLPVTRAQMATFVWRFSNEPAAEEPLLFTDVPAGTYYTEAVRWLAEKGVTTGVSPTMFDPHGLVTRAQMATFLWRLAGEPEVGELGLNRHDPEVTTVADEDDAEFVELDGVGESTLEWTGDDAPDVGQILAFGMSDETPDGFLGKVTDVDGDTVTTEPVGLSEAVPEAEVDLLIDLSEPDESGLTMTAVLEEAMQNATLECEGSTEIWIDTSLTVDPEMTLEASWSPLGGPKFRAGITLEITPEIRGHAAGAVDCTATVSVDGPELKPITFSIGGIPVVINPKLSFEAELYAGFAAEAEPYVRYTETVGIEIAYDDGWSVDYPTSPTTFGACPAEDTIDEHYDGVCFGVDFSGDASVGIELRARLDLLAYDSIGLYLTVGPLLELNAQFADPWWSLDAGIRARAGVSISLFDLWETDHEFGQIDLYRKTLARAPYNDPRQPDDFVDVTNLKATQVDAGNYHTCAITQSEEIMCWGAGSRYQLGNGQTSSRDAPVLVDTVSDAAPVDISAGGSHSCAVFADGTIECWGENDWGQIGNGSDAANVTTPAPVSGITTARRVEAGNHHTCAILEDFTVWCWGSGGAGATGTDYTQKHTPVQVDVDGAVIDLATSIAHTCVATADGAAWCWGNNGFGEIIDDGSIVRTAEPIRIGTRTDISGVAAGYGVTCIVGRNGRLDCFGRNIRGQVGVGSDASSIDTPTRVPDIYNLGSVSIGHEHGCAIDTRIVSAVITRTPKCWGSNVDLETGRFPSPFADFTVPGAVLTFADVVSITAGRAHSCAVTIAARVVCWGSDYHGQLGNDGSLPGGDQLPVYVVTG